MGPAIDKTMSEIETSPQKDTDAEQHNEQQHGEDPEPTNLSRDKRPEIKGYGPEVQREADGSIRTIEVKIQSGSRGRGLPYLTLTYYVSDGTAHVKTIENTRGDGIERAHLRMLALADDVVGRVPGVVTVTRFEREIAETRETYERELDERCAEDGCYDMADRGLDSGRCREHTPENQR